MSKKRVIVCDDSSLMRMIICDILNADDRLEVVGTAADGKEAVEKCLELKPDVLTIDMEMPRYNGTYAIKEIMRKCPTPMLIVSSLGNTNIQPILDALKLGAIDYVNKPGKSNTAKIRQIDTEIIRNVLAVANSNMETKFKHAKTNTFEHTFAPTLPYDIIAIGSSTGGPGALEEVVSTLPSNLPLPVVIAQHMPANFIKSFVKRLNDICALEVVVGEEGMEVKPGMIAIMNGEVNSTIIKRGIGRVYIGKTDQQYRNFNNPSVDAMFETCADQFKSRAIGVILTGMGKDGGDGLKKMFDQKAFTVGQDEKSCVVYGMPRYAKSIGAVHQEVPITQIGGFIISCLS